MGWTKLDKELREKLKNYKYSFYETWNLVGCGEKTLRRYMDSYFIMPIKTSDEYKFTQEMVDKVKFIHSAKSGKYMTTWAAAALWDYMIAHKLYPDFDEVEKFIVEYKKMWD